MGLAVRKFIKLKTAPMPPESGLVGHHYVQIHFPWISAGSNHVFMDFMPIIGD
jgi:hypothetical protein